MKCSLKTCQRLIVLLCTALPAQGANSQDVREAERPITETVKPRVVLLTAEAQIGETGQQLSATRNGAIVSSAGLVLTTYDLIRSFTKAEPGSLKVKAADPTDPEKTVRLAVLEYSQSLNLLLLSLPTGEYDHFAVSRTDTPETNERVLISGYRSANDYYFDEGELPLASIDINAEVSLQAMAIKTDPDFNLDGGPVYKRNGELIGIVNGSTTSGRVIYSRLSYAAPLLSVVRADNVMAAVDARLPEQRAVELTAALRELRTSTTLDCDVSIHKGEERFYITYDKMLASPAVKEIRLRITGIRATAPFVTETFPKDDEVGMVITARAQNSTDQTRGWFDASTEGVAIINSLMLLYKDITDFKFNVVAELDDGQILADGTVVVEATTIPLEQVKGLGQLQ